MLHDLKFGFRMLGKSPGVTAIAILALALGIGANTAIFSGLNAVFIKGLPVPNAQQLVALYFHQAKSAALPLFSYLDLRDTRKQASGSMDVFGYFMGIDGLTTGAHADRVVTNYVTGNYFSALGVKPALGRLILPSEGGASRTDPVIVLAYSYWQSRFGRSRNVIGKTVRVDGQPLTIVGVAQKGFRGVLTEIDVAAFMPLNMQYIEFPGLMKSRTGRALFALARLKDGVGVARAKAALAVIAHRLSQEYPTTDSGAAIQVLPQKEVEFNPLPKPGEYQQELALAGLFLVLGALVLVLACFNVANILLVRASARQHEMTIRTALGAPRHRLVRQLLTESSLLALFGCVAGLLVGAWGSSLLSSIHISAGVPVTLNFSFDWRVFAYTVGAAVLTGVLVGVAPAARASRADPGEALHEGGRTTTARHHRLRNALVVAQLAGSIVILTIAGLFTRSLQSAEHVDLGFQSDHLVNFRLDPHGFGYSNAQGQEFYRNLLSALRGLPGVQSAAVSFTFPTGTYTDQESIYVEGHLLLKGQPPPALNVDPISPGYFKTMGIPLMEGRSFTDADTAKTQLVAVINQTMATELWPHEDPIGRNFRLDSQTGPLVKVVGVARNTKYRSLQEGPTPFLYLPLTQHFISMEVLQVRSALPMRRLVRLIEGQVHQLAPGLPVSDVQTMRVALDGPYGFYPFHLHAYEAGVLGLLGLILATVGVYGVVSYSTSQRTHEIGIRMALGAEPADIWKIVVGQGVKLLAFGLALGLVGAFALTRAMTSVLFGVSAHDPATYVAVSALIVAVTLLACIIPARRAMGVQPATALRYE